MIKQRSAGLVVYRLRQDRLEVLLGHMGAPWWAKKDIGAWSIPKGLINEAEEPLAAAKREFSEELGIAAPAGDYIELGTIEQHNHKTVTAWAVAADPDISHIQSNTFKLEWPPRSGQTQDFPEIDRAAWFNPELAAQKSVRGQVELFVRLAEYLKVPFGNQDHNQTDSKQGTLF